MSNSPTNPPIITFGLTNIGCDQSNATFQTVVQQPPFVAQSVTGDTMPTNETPFNWDLLPFIHPQWLGNDTKCYAIYEHVKNILNQDLAIVCSQLYAMHESKLLMLIGVPTRSIYLRLKDMGFSCAESTFYDNYKAPK